MAKVGKTESTVCHLLARSSVSLGFSEHWRPTMAICRNNMCPIWCLSAWICSLGVSNITTESQNRCYTGYFREPHWNSIWLPEISRVTWQLKSQPENQWCILTYPYPNVNWYRMRFDRNPIWVNLKFHHTVVKRIGSTSWQLVSPHGSQTH